MNSNKISQGQRRPTTAELAWFIELVARECGRQIDTRR